MSVEQYQPGEKYVLPRDESERERLNRQQKYMRKTVYDGRVIYDKTVKLGTDSRVLDAGTGSGAWILDLAQEMPQINHLDAVDVSSANFPGEHSPNIHFAVASVTDLPLEWTGLFDFVHQRLLMPALLATEWPGVVAELFRLLKPGGSVQLVEFSPDQQTGSDIPAHTKCWHTMWTLYETMGLMIDCGRRLPELMEKAGFVDVCAEGRIAPIGGQWGEVGILGNQNFETAFRNMGIVVVKMGGLGIVQSMEEWKKLVDEAVSEWNSHEGSHFAFTIICAKKPL